MKTIYKLTVLGLAMAQLLCPSASSAKTDSYPYAHFSFFMGTSDGLSQNDITAITQDSAGFMWLGTRNGLNRYDGYSVVQYKQDLQDSSTLGSNIITALAAGTDGSVWVGTLNGLERYDPASGVFNKYAYEDEYGISGIEFGEVSSISVTSSGSVWVLSGNRLSLYDENIDKFISWALPYGEKTRLSRIVPCGENMLWVGSEMGLYLFSIYDKSFRAVLDGRIISLENGSSAYELIIGTNSGLLRYDCLSGQTREILMDGKSLGRIETLLKTNDGKIWAGEQRNGLYMLDGERLVSFRHNSFDSSSLTSDKILSLFQDATGVLWVGTLQGGVNALDLNMEQYSVITPEIRSDEDAKITAVMAEGDSVLWIGHGEGRLERISRKPDGGRTSYIIRFPDRYYAYDLGQVMAIKEKDENTLWVGTGKGLYELDKKSGKSVPVNIFYEDGKTLFPNLINGMETDSDDNLWCCSPGGIFILRDGRLLKHITNDTGENSIPRNNIQYIYRDRLGTMWVASRGGGLSRFTGTIEQPSFRNYLCDESPDSLNHNNVCSIYEDTAGRLWIGTWGGGVNLMDRETGVFRHYTVNDGLLDNTVFGIAEDSHGVMWFSTYTGLSSLDKNGVFSRFVFAENGRSNEILFAEMSMTADDKLYLCCLEGLVEFDTGFSIRKEELRPVRITSLNSNEVNILTDVKQSYREKSFSVDFSSFDYTMAKGTYSYILEGVDAGWTRTAGHSVKYQNLSPGKYRFRVRYSDLYGNNSPETSFNVEIVPPIWATKYAYMLYSLLFLCIIGFVLLYIERRNRQKRESLLAKMRMDSEKELYDAKMMFFTNISHEIRTPLTLILGPVHRLKVISEGNDEMSKMVDIMEKNGKRLLSLVNQLLDFRKIDSGKMTVDMEEVDMPSLVNRLAALFSDTASTKSIRLSTEIRANVSISADSDKVEKILTNLISNAMKFSRSFVHVYMGLEDGKVKITVSDDGPGISEEQSKKIFDRFYQVDSHSGGSGIGLNLSLQLAYLMGGDLSVSTPASGIGSVFTFTLPAYDLKYLEEQENWTESGEESSDKPQIMIVDDNKDLRFFMSSSLGDDYRVLEVADGERALEAFDMALPDLVISDIMMPGIDGFELIEKIRDNRKMSNIPIIIVSARTSEDDKVRCLELGADAYITKPFSGHYLKLQVDKLIQLQKNAREQLRMEMMTAPKDIEVVSSSHKILQQIVALMEEHISDADFNVELLGEALCMSRMQLYRVLKNLLGETPAEFMRNFRLARAASLLEKSELNVNEVCYSTGFNDPKYFTSLFKKKYGELPRDYRKTHKTEEEPQ